uniref:Uncharacterized protein n=1 Tax=Arundo donax TaxID=35708 RepID=A0A0A9HAL9_ARUDO
MQWSQLCTMSAHLPTKDTPKNKIGTRECYTGIKGQH